MADLRLIPKKSEKFEFWKNVPTMFFSSKNRLIVGNFEIFRPRNLRKIVKKKIQNLRVDYFPEIFWKTYFFYRYQRKIVIARSSPKKVFDPWIKSYEAYSIFRTYAILGHMIFKFVTFVHISNQNFMADSVQLKFFVFAHAHFFKPDFRLSA